MSGSHSSSSSNNITSSAQPGHIINSGASTEDGRETTTTVTDNPSVTTSSPHAAQKPSIDTSASSSADTPVDFTGDINTNNSLPTQKDLFDVHDAIVVDEDGKSFPFKHVFSGPNVANRVLVIFVRHFFCGNCQEYLKALSAELSVDSLLNLPIPTSIAVIGCGAPNLIPDYRSRTSCPFPIYSDPTNKLYASLGMVKTLSMGARPEYQRNNNVVLIVRSLFQNLRQVPIGGALAAGDMRQVGGEFLFELIAGSASSPATPDGRGPRDEEKRIVWCHRMRNTRDHVEVPELREVLGFEDDGIGGKNGRRWSRALGSRKGTGLSGIEGTSLSKEVAA